MVPLTLEVKQLAGSSGKIRTSLPLPFSKSSLDQAKATLKELTDSHISDMLEVLIHLDNAWRNTFRLQVESTEMSSRG